MGSWYSHWCLTKWLVGSFFFLSAYDFSKILSVTVRQWHQKATFGLHTEQMPKNIPKNHVFFCLHGPHKVVWRHVEAKFTWMIEWAISGKDDLGVSFIAKQSLRFARCLEKCQWYSLKWWVFMVIYHALKKKKKYWKKNRCKTRVFPKNRDTPNHPS